MISRTTTLGTTTSMLNYITSGESKYYDLMEQASSGDKVTKPSDDPLATKSILNVNTQLNKLSNYLSNMSLGQNELDVLDNSLSSLTNSIQSASDLATQASNGTYTQDDYNNFKIQIDQIIQNVTDLANTSYDGTYIFSGTKTSTQTYTTATDSSGNITSVSYNGTPSNGDYQRNVTISDGISVGINTTGDSVFGTYNSTDATKSSGLLGTLGNLSAALKNGGSVTLSDGSTVTVNSCIDSLSNNLDTVSTTRTKFASVTQRFSMTKSSISTSQTQLKSYRSDLKDADLSEVLTNLSTQETALQATMSVTSSLLSGASLLDYLR